MHEGRRSLYAGRQSPNSPKSNVTILLFMFQFYAVSYDIVVLCVKICFGFSNVICLFINVTMLLCILLSSVLMISNNIHVINYKNM